MHWSGGRTDLRLFLEPGRAVVGDTAVLVTRIENQKTKLVRDEFGAAVGEERWLAVDAGYNVLTMARAYSWYYPTVVAGRAGEPCTERVRLAGPLCDGGDVFPGEDESGLRCFPAGTGLGDVVVFQNVGAYALDSGSRYNARPLAAAYAVEDGRRPAGADQAQGHRRGPRGPRPGARRGVSVHTTHCARTLA